MVVWFAFTSIFLSELKFAVIVASDVFKFMLSLADIFESFDMPSSVPCSLCFALYILPPLVPRVAT